MTAAPAHQLTPADTLSLLLAMRVRLSDPAAWGHGVAAMERAPFCVLGTAADLAGMPGDALGRYKAIGNANGELSTVASTLSTACDGVERSPWDSANHVGLLNDRLHRSGDHPALLAWLDRAIALASADLGGLALPLAPTGAKPAVAVVA